MPDFPQVASPTNLYPQPPSQGVLGNPANILDLAGRMQSLQKQRMDIQAQQAIGDAVQRNTDPATGAIDQAGFARDIMANPAARWKALEAMSTMYQQQTALQNLSTAQLGRIHTALGSLPGNYTDEQLNRTKLDLQGPGMNPELVRRAFSQIPPMPRADDHSPEADHARWVRNDIVAGHRKAQMTAEQLEAPRNITIDRGRGPETIPVPGGSYLRPGMPGTGGGAPGAAGAASTGYTPPGYTGGAGIVLTPEQSALAAEFGKRGTQLIGLQDKLAQENQLLTELKELGEKVGFNFTGPTSDLERHVRELAQRVYGPFGPKDLTLSRAQIFDKILNQVIGSQREQGQESVADLGVIQASNPSLAKTPYAKVGAVNQLLAQNEFKEAMRQEFVRAGGIKTPAMYADWRNKPDTAAVLDPTVWAFNRLRPEEKDAYYKRLFKESPERARQLEQRYNYARSRGWVKDLP